MSWEDYKRNFRNKAKSLGLRSERQSKYVTECLKYAHSLYDKKLPIIYDNKHLSLLVGYDLSLLYKISNAPKSFYRNFQIKKKSGGIRYISEPLPTLKIIQRWVLDNILNYIEISKFAKGFRANYSIKNAAKFHLNQNYILSLDIKDFFPTISSNRIYSLFLRLGYCSQIAMMLTKISTLDDSLPQGAPTSPLLSNIVSIKLDKRIGGFALKTGLRYTRYADDIAISGNDIHVGSVIKFIRKILLEEGFELNEEKTRLMLPHQRQEVVGITVNKKINASKKLRRSVRKDIYYIKKYGLDSHMANRNITKRNYLRHIIGLVDFILFLRPDDNDMREAKKLLLAYSN